MATDEFDDPPSPADGLKYRWEIFRNTQNIVDDKFIKMLGNYLPDDNNERGLVYKMLADIRTDIENMKALIGDAPGPDNDYKSAMDYLDTIDTDITMDDIEDIDIGTFGGTVPDPLVLTTNFPDGPTNMAEIEDALHDKFLADLTDPSPAITDAVWDDIVNRESEKALLLHRDTLDAISDDWSKRGFTLPSGYLINNLAMAEIDYSNKRLDVNRDVAIKNLELTNDNTKFTEQQSMAFLVNRVDIYKAEVQAETARIDGLVRAYLGEVEGYKGEAQVYTALTDATIREFEGKLKQVMAEADLNVKNADIALKKVEYIYNMALEGTKAIMAVESQAMAGALAGVSASASLDARNSASYQYSTDPSY